MSRVTVATSTRSLAPRRRPLPTEPEHVPLPRLRRARAFRRAGIVGLVILVVLGLSGVLGYRTGSVAASGGGYELRLSYPAIGRPGVPVQWILHIHRDAGLPKQLTIGTSLGYFDILDMNDVEPQVSSATSAAGRVLWSFQTPGGTDMTILVDAFVSVNAHRGATATTAVMQNGRPVAQVTYETWVAP
jgi:hypothetical protein